MDTAKPAKSDIPRGVIAEWTVTILLLLFGTATLVQAYVIPTGSMAPTLMGQHMRFQGENTGYVWPVGPQYVYPGTNDPRKTAKDLGADGVHFGLNFVHRHGLIVFVGAHLFDHLSIFTQWLLQVQLTLDQARDFVGFKQSLGLRFGCDGSARLNWMMMLIIPSHPRDIGAGAIHSPGY
jgi:hypothetical protein